MIHKHLQEFNRRYNEEFIAQSSKLVCPTVVPQIKDIWCVGERVHDCVLV